MANEIIKAGYRITVESWENDLDVYATEVVEGLSKEECQLYANICKAFLNDRIGRHVYKLCNIYEPSDAQCDHVVDTIISFVKASGLKKYNGGDLKEIFEDGPHMRDYQVDLTYEILSDLGLTNKGDFYTRVVDKYAITYVENDIVLPDVTKDF